MRCLRILAPVLAPGTGAARSDLSRLELLAIRQSGHVVGHGYVRAVFYAPLGLLWSLRPEGAHDPHSFSEVLLVVRV